MVTSAAIYPDNNVASTLNFRSIRPIQRSEVPLAPSRGGRASVLRNLQVVKDFNEMLKFIVTLGVSPYEVVGEIDITSEDVQKEVKKRKSFTGTFRTLLRSCVKQSGLQSQIDIVERDHGKRFFVVGKEL
jgi:hypothetical protein